ncbi:hypothetical protein HPB48_006759 [Haemaphysalis longicornis]|uniref:Uncharacterized protein n=1 Tax=Haemaphysalis longicornis TaxID=44386 RepID=A0A9J6FLP0_HAELO|nr:hypothetical protein HPB48_006759 [Haemaphysalis longicornis]
MKIIFLNDQKLGTRGVKAHDHLFAKKKSADTTASPPAEPRTARAKMTLYPIKRKQPLPRLPISDYKIIYRPGGGLDLRPVNGGMLLQTVCQCADVDFTIARTQDKFRINPVNNCFTSTPAYVAAPDDAKGIIYNAVYGQTEDEISQKIINLNNSRNYTIADARQLRRTKSLLITFIGTKEVPREIIFGSIYTCYPFKAKLETCFNRRQCGPVPEGEHRLVPQVLRAAPTQTTTGLHTQMHPVQRRSLYEHQEMQAAFQDTRQLQGKDVYQYRDSVATRTVPARIGERRASPVQKSIQIELQDKAQQKPLQLLPTPPEIREQGTSKPGELESAGLPVREKTRSSGHN